MAADAETKTVTDQQFMFKIPINDIIISSDVWYDYKIVLIVYFFQQHFSQKSWSFKFDNSISDDGNRDGKFWFPLWILK